MKPPLRSLLPCLLLPLALLVPGCASDEKQVPHALGRAVTRSSGETNTYTINDDDKQMESAVRRARRSVGQFITAVRNPPPNTRDFLIKKLFVSKDGTVAEHIWLADVQFTGNRFVGVIDNRSDKFSDLKLGMKASVNPDEITDWSYVENGRLVGGYTIRMLYAEMSDEEKQQFQKQADFRIEN